jgi:hypothetical protein
MKWQYIAVAVSACALSAPIVAQPLEPACAVPEASLVRSKHFRKLQLEALDLNQTMCLALDRGKAAAAEPDQRAHFLSFSIKVRDVATAAFAGLPIDDLSVPFDRFIAVSSQSDNFGWRLPAFRVELSDDPNEWLLFHFDDRASAGRIAVKQDNGACRSRFNADCDAVLDDFANAINYYKYSYTSLTAAESVAKLDRMSEQWDAFLDSGRSQTLLDLSLTTALERRQFRQGFLVGPPKRQWTLLHPDLAYEHIRQAPAGQRDELTLVIEWFGVNWWSSDSPLAEIPFGISLVSAYADRPDMSSAGHGVVFHFDNKYSVGWTRRRGSDGFFVSIDLLRLIDNKRERLNRYRRKLE